MWSAFAIMIVFLIFTALREYLFYLERQILLDRVMSKDINEFKLHQEPIKKEEKKEERVEPSWL